TGFSEVISSNLNALLTRADLLNRNPDLPEFITHIRKNLNGNVVALEAEVVRDLVKGVVELKSRKYGLRSTDQKNLVGSLRHGFYLDNMGKTGQRPGLGDICSILLFDGPGHSQALLAKSSHLENLAMQLKSTPEAAVQRDALVMKQVGDLLAPTRGEV